MKKTLAIAMLANVIASGIVSARAENRADALVKATGLAEQLLMARKSCEAVENAGDIEGIALANPSMFHGIGPKSESWPEARDAYVRYGVSTCVPQDIEAYSKLAKVLYASEFSDQEILEILAFFESAVGKKFSSISYRLTSELNKKMHEESAQERAKGVVVFENEMNTISLKAEAQGDETKANPAEVP